MLLLVAFVGFRVWQLIQQNQPRPDLATPGPSVDGPASPRSDTGSGELVGGQRPGERKTGANQPGEPPPATDTLGGGGPGEANRQPRIDVSGRTASPGPPPKPGIPGRPGGNPTPSSNGRGNPGRPVEPPPRPGLEDPLAGPALPLPRGETQVVRIRRVIDGDTLLLQDGTRVRMIGVDTPETKMEGAEVQPFGPEASEFVKQALARGPVTLVFDGESEDNYGRILAHVCVNDRFVGEDLIRLGLARALYRHPYSNEVKDRFRAAENAAKREKRGIWSLAEPPQHPAPATAPRNSSPGNAPRGGTSRPPSPRPPGSRSPTPAGSRDF